MKIKRLWVSQNRCLKDFNIEFDISDLGTSTILIGGNGTGKTTLIETILEIVCSFDPFGSRIEPQYDYVFEYEFRRCNVVIKKEKQNYILIINNNLYSTGKLEQIRDYIERKKIVILPQRVMALYSGRNEKIRQFCNCTDKFTLFTDNYIASLFDDDKEWIALFRRSNQTILKSTYNYFSDDIVPILLISILGGEESKAKRYLLNFTQFSSINSMRIQINLKKLETYLYKQHKTVNLMDLFYIIVDIFDNRFTSLLKNTLVSSSAYYAHFHINNIQQYNFDSVSLFNFFALLKNYLHAKIDLTISFGTDYVDYHNISEGQMQLIKILGMMGICKEEDCLVLVDEPDAHMNPTWKYQISNIIEDLLEDALFTHALIATHEPLVINGVKKEKIKIFQKKEIHQDTGISYATDVITPKEDIVGWGIDGILQSEYFGLESSLDVNTKNKMKLKYDLLVKKKSGTLTNSEKERLKLITTELESMIFARNIPTDIYYDEYVAAMHKIYSETQSTLLTAGDIIERNNKAEEILRGLLKI